MKIFQKNFRKNSKTDKKVIILLKREEENRLLKDNYRGNLYSPARYWDKDTIVFSERGVDVYGK